MNGGKAKKIYKLIIKMFSIDKCLFKTCVHILNVGTAIIIYFSFPFTMKVVI